jgi:hypothetical protein
MLDHILWPVESKRTIKSGVEDTLFRKVCTSSAASSSRSAVVRIGIARLNSAQSNVELCSAGIMQRLCRFGERGYIEERIVLWLGGGC